jgi:hypothetical protein
MDELFKLIGLGTPFIYAVATYTFFHWLDANASDQAKAAITRLLEFNQYDNAKVARAILEVFDRVYTRPLFTWHAFSRSAFITTSVAVIFFFESGLYLLTLRPGTDATYVSFVASIVFSLLLNVIMDFGSLLAIRQWLISLSNRPLIALLTGSLIGVIILSVGFLVRFLCALFIMTIVYAFEVYTFALERSFWLHEFFQERFFERTYLMIPATIVFAWLPLFGISLLLIRLFNLLSPVVSKLQWAIKGGPDHPLIAVGYVAAAIVFVIAVVWRILLPAPEPSHATQSRGAVRVLAMPVSEEFLGLNYAPKIS